VVLNAQRHLCPVEGWGSLILWQRAGRLALLALAHAAGELHAQELLQQVASVAPSGSARSRCAAWQGKQA